MKNKKFNKSKIIGKETLERLSELKEFNEWVISKVSPYIGKRILEVGGGVGNLTSYLLENKELVLSIDINLNYVTILKNRFVHYSNFIAKQIDITNPEVVSFKKFNIDTIICINVLEHIKYDKTALKNMYMLLKNGGNLILLVPAFKMLYGTLDKALGHYRRYGKMQISNMLKNTGFRIIDIFYLNLFGMPGWFINGKIMGTKILPKRQLKIYKKLFPLFKFIEDKTRYPIGQSLIVIGEKTKDE